ncbi:ABC transporter permease [Cohnella sp.]|uniref:ABC transporter permease n=1 Tax=Cohnella sp. TaxID=1883426 RepID=UPI00356AFB11
MANFINLILNENMKIYRRIRTWIMFGFILLIPPLVSLAIYLAGGDDMSGWSIMMTESYILYSLITIFAVVVAADSVAGEFTWGTIKLLLIRPWSRSTILLSKYLATLLFALFFTAAAFVVTFLSNWLIFGLGDTTLSTSGLSNWEYIIRFYLFQFITLIMIVTFGFTMSSAFRSGGLAIGLSISFLFAGNLITGLFALANKGWVKYVLFMHLDLTNYIDGGTGPIPNHPTTLGFSLAVLAVYFILFNAVSWTVFKKRDVAA